MKANFVAAAFLVLVFLMPLVSASTVTRSFSNNSVLPGETVSVMLDVAVTGGETYYLIDESVPQSWIILNPDPETEPGHVKWAVFQGTSSTSYTYEAKSPQSGGTYEFSGKYMFEGMDAEGSIAGQNTVKVQAATAVPTKPGFEAAIAPVIVVGAVIISLALYRSRSGKHV
jgi:hypothetical protein